MGGVKDSSIMHGKFMALNQGHEIDNCKVLDHEKRFMGFSRTFHGIFIKLMLVVREVVVKHYCSLRMQECRFKFYTSYGND